MDPISAESMTIRPERPEERRAVEELVRDAFWDIYEPGSAETWLVHVLREHEDFVPELDLVGLADNEVVASIMFTRARLASEQGRELRALTLGPLAVRPDLQRRHLGSRLTRHALETAREMGFEAVVLFGAPLNYVGRGFVSCKRLDVSLEDGTYPAAMLVRELVPGALAEQSWTYVQSPALEISTDDANAYDAQNFSPRAHAWKPGQEEFYILSNATLGTRAS